MKKEYLLKEALEIVTKRGLNYGTPENNFGRIALLWSVYLDRRERGVIPTDTPTIDETDVAALMILMKVARLMEKPDHYDSWLDIAGYAACGAEVSRAGEEDPSPGFTQKEFQDIAEASLSEHMRKAADFTSGLDEDPPVMDTYVSDVAPERPDQPKPSGKTRRFKIGDKVVPRWTTTSPWTGVVHAVFDQGPSTMILVMWNGDRLMRCNAIDAEHAAL